MKNRKTLRTIAGILFLIWTLFYVIYEINYYTKHKDYTLSVWVFPELIASLLIAVSCFTSIKALSIVGAGIYGANSIRILVNYIKLRIQFEKADLMEIYTRQVILYVLVLAFAIMIIIMALIKEKHHRMIGIIAAVIALASFILNTVIYSITNEYPLLKTLDFYNLKRIPMALGAFFLGCALSLPEPEKESDQWQIENDAETLGMLSDLKSLLDKGIISKEDYDEKKRVLLGQ